MRARNLFILFMLAGSCVQAGELFVADVIREMSKRYLQATSYSMNIEVEIYDNTSPQKPVQVFSGSAIKQGENMLNKMMGQVTLYNGNCVVVVDEDAQLILYSRNEKPSAKLKKSFDAFSLPDSILSNYKSVNFTNGDAGNYTITFLTADTDPLYKSFTIEVDRNTFAFKKITYLMKSEDGSPYDRIQIRFTNTRFNVKVPEGTFSEQRYVVKSSGKLKPAAAYSGYQLVNQEEFKN